MAMESLHEDGTVELDVKREIGDVATSYSAFETGDVIVAKVTPCFENGKAALAPDMVHGVAFGTTEITVLRASAGMVPEFLYYVVTEDRFRQMGVASMTGAGGLRRVPDRFVRDYSFRSPPLDEQRQIAEYLDRETGKIDELITKQEQLAQMLTERVTALWANRIDLLKAQHPTVSIRRVISSIVDGPFGSSLTSAHYSDEGARVIRLGNIGIFTFKDVDEAYVPLDYARELSAHAVLAGDVVVAGLGDEKMPLGRAAVVPETLGIALVKADCYRVRPNGQVSAEYLAWALSSPQLREQFKVLSRGSTRQRLNTAVVREATIPLPPRFEQDHAVEQFTRESVRTGQVVLKASKVVETLRERRAALISAAVTGKIDVRGL